MAQAHRSRNYGSLSSVVHLIFRRKTLKVVLYGASGMIGSRILAELLNRGHQVTAVVRNPAKITASGVRVLKGDVTEPESVAQTAKGADAAISAYGPPKGEESTLSASIHALLEGLPAIGIKRLIVVGGAGSLEAAPGASTRATPGAASRLPAPPTTMSRYMPIAGSPSSSAWMEAESVDSSPLGGP